MSSIVDCVQLAMFKGHRKVPTSVMIGYNRGRQTPSTGLNGLSVNKKNGRFQGSSRPRLLHRYITSLGI